MKVPAADHYPVVDDRVWVAPGAWVVGKVTIGTEASIWYGAVLRADTDFITVGARSNIQDGCILHVDPGFPITLGRGVSVGHRAVLHGCTIEDDVLIGMGAIVMNGAHIGAGSIVGAGALVTEGTVIPPASVVTGLPARTRATATAAQIEATRRNARDYVEVAQRARSRSEPRSTD